MSNSCPGSAISDSVWRANPEEPATIRRNPTLRGGRQVFRHPVDDLLESVAVSKYNGRRGTRGRPHTTNRTATVEGREETREVSAVDLASITARKGAGADTPPQRDCGLENKGRPGLSLLVGGGRKGQVRNQDEKGHRTRDDRLPKEDRPSARGGTGSGSAKTEQEITWSRRSRPGGEDNRQGLPHDVRSVEPPQSGAPVDDENQLRGHAIAVQTPAPGHRYDAKQARGQGATSGRGERRRLWRCFRYPAEARPRAEGRSTRAGFAECEDCSGSIEI